MGDLIIIYTDTYLRYYWQIV